MSTYKTLINAVASHAAETGHFDQVQGAELTGAPGNGLSCGVWVNDAQAIAAGGLASTSVRIEFYVRVYSSAFTDPPDVIDPAVTEAVDTLWSDYIGAFTLGGVLRMVDVKGAHGAPLRMQAGYLTIGAQQGTSGRTYRVMTTMLPLIVNDLYTEAP